MIGDNMTGKEYLEEQVMPLQNDSYSLLKYPEEDFFRCPYCGEKMKSAFVENGNAFEMCCDCEGATTEKQRLYLLKTFKDKYEATLEMYNKFKAECEEAAKKSGIKFAAQHYMSLKEQRNDFDSEIEELAK
jgi:hypothetical protein